MGAKGDTQRIKVVESASFCLAHFGERGTTFQAIADHCKLSQASVVKYLKTRDNIFPEVLNYWISRARVGTEKALEKPQSAEKKLRNYLKISYELFFEKHEISITILTLHYLAGTNEKYRLINSQIKQVAQERIAGIIEAGISDGSFRKLNSKIAAKTIHNCLMGYLLCSVSTTTQPIDLQLPDALEDLCMSMLTKS